jgi:maltose alpha-D-glucosyltransferase/alpha-amylase
VSGGSGAGPGDRDEQAAAARGRRAGGQAPATRRWRQGRGPLGDDLWYKDAIFYEVPVRSFYDSNGDGIGDFRGLTEKLDYIRDLGVDCIWLLPMYPSPLRDDGYDIADFYDIHPDLGQLSDFRDFLAAAHGMGLRVIADLVLNHTSDRHPWFQAARLSDDPAVRDYYVWSDDPERCREARVIFTDSETSNWAWDPVARRYYWHRFFSHQPDLNYDHPPVRQAILDVVAYWLNMGLDGFRCDAVPYLYEREATSCENLPETHAFLKELRAFVDRGWPGRVLLAEANQWPEDVRAYFGDGDEMHMAFHFPLMPRLFMAIRREGRRPITDILARTPPIPDNCQWCLFLRNHDELTLEMVSDPERDYMWTEFARDPKARLNLGIRRRLAPLLDNGRRQIELMTSLLLSLPGSPVVYYGDELGMGDNIFLGDRMGVRTPMQWSIDRNGGFSRADPSRLWAPVNQDPVYNYQAINVEGQRRTPTSLLRWTQRLIATRKRTPVFGRGGIEFLEPANPRVLAFVRAHGDERVLVVANLSRFVQPVELDLRAHRGCVPVELIGGAALPPVGDRPYFLTLGPHGFFWLRLDRPAAASAYRATAPGEAAACADQATAPGEAAACADQATAPAERPDPADQGTARRETPAPR